MVSAVDREEEGGTLAPKVTSFLRPEAQMWYFLFARTGAELGENQVVTSKTLVAGKTWRRATVKYKVACWTVYASREMHWSTATGKGVSYEGWKEEKQGPLIPLTSKTEP